MPKKLVRGASWSRFDWFLGVEFTLAALTSALIYIFDLAKTVALSPSITKDLSNKITATVTFIALTFFLLLWVLSVHQDWEKRDENPMGQIIWLGIIANFFGSGLLAFFIIFIKGV